MQALKKNKKSNRFGDGVPEHEASNHVLEAPEHAPAHPEQDNTEEKSVKKARGKTGRTLPFSTKVTKHFDDDFRTVAFNKKLKMAELLEEMLVLYKETNGLR